MGPDPAIFRALIERCPMVTYVADAAGAITYISPQVEDWTGLPARRWTEEAKFWYTTVHPDDLERVVARGRQRRDARPRVPDGRTRRDVALGLGAGGVAPG